MVGRQPATVRVHSGLARVVETEMALADIVAALAFRAEPEVFDHAHNGYAERVVCHKHVDLVGRNACVGECARPGLRAGADGDVAAVFAVFGSLARADYPRGLFAAVRGYLRRCDYHRAAAVRNHAALKQMQRMGDYARVYNILHGNFVDAHEFEVGHRLDRLRVSHSMSARYHRYFGELLVGCAILMLVAVLDHAIVGDERLPPRVLHIGVWERRPLACRSRRADVAPVGVRGGAVGEQRHAALARRYHRGGVIGVKLVGCAAHGGVVNDLGFEAEIFGYAKPADALVRAGVIDGVDVRPRQPRVFQRFDSGGGFDLQGACAGAHHSERVFVDADYRGLSALGHLESPYIISRRIAGVLAIGFGWLGWVRVG